ncbi:MAG: hypothetical protein J6V36_05320 [Clostridia bacterium]|nr:hypothetical protein [Clostridia bacterium]
MIKNAYKKLSNVLKKYSIISLLVTACISLLILIVSFSFLAFALVLVFGIITTLFFILLDYIKSKSENSRIRITTVIIAILVIFSSSAFFIFKTNNEKSLYSVFSRQIKVDNSEKLLKMKNDQNIILTVDAETVFETKYIVEKVVSEKGSEDDTSNVWDGDEWIDSVITDRIVLYYYCVFKLDDKYFVAKLAPEIFEQINKQDGKVTINCLALKPGKSDLSVCNAICDDISTVIYPVDHFEGEGEKDFYEDLEKVVGEKSVIAVADTTNLLKDRVHIAASFLIFISSAIYVFLSILFSSSKVEKQKN